MNAVQASKTVRVDADPPLTRGRQHGWGSIDRCTHPVHRGHGVMAEPCCAWTACRAKVDGLVGLVSRTLRKGGPTGESEGVMVLMKPGNAGTRDGPLPPICLQ